MNKKFSTLVAVLLAAGAWTTLDAKVIEVTTPEIGQSYVLGSAFSGNTVTNLVKATITPASSEAVAAFGNEWTLEDAGKEGTVPVFYLKNGVGNYLMEGGSAGLVQLGSTPAVDKASALKFKLEGNNILVAVNSATSYNTVGQYLIVDTDLKTGASATNIIVLANEAEESLTLAHASINQTVSLAEGVAFNKDVYYFIGADGTNVMKCDDKNGTVSAVAVGNLQVTNVDAALWKIERTDDNGTISYKFVNKANKDVVAKINGQTSFPILTTNEAKGVTLKISADQYVTNAFASGAVAAAATFGIYNATLSPVEGETLNALLRGGFNMTVKVTEKGKEELKDATAFGGKLVAVKDATGDAITSGATDFCIMSGEQFLVLNTKKANGDNGDGIFELVDEVGADHLAFFSVMQSAGYKSTSMVAELRVAKATGMAGAKKAIVHRINNDYYLTAKTTLAGGDVLPYISLSALNMADYKDFLGKFMNISFISDEAEAKAKPQNVIYKKNGVLATAHYTGASPAADYVDRSTVLLSSPETQWAVTAVAADGKFTLTNRESKVTISGISLYKTAVSNEYIVASATGVSELTDDLVKITFVENHTKFDGYKTATANELRNQVFHIGQYHNETGNVAAYWAENHQTNGTHQLGVIADAGQATKWTLRLDNKNKDGVSPTEELSNNIDTVFIVTPMATIQDGRLVQGDVDTKNIKLDTLAILPYQIQNKGNLEYVRYATGTNLDYYVCHEKGNVETSADRFALKMKPNGTYNIVTLTTAGTDKTSIKTLGDDKVFVGNSNQWGSLKKLNTYKPDDNSLMVVEPIDAPEYRKVAKDWGDIVKIYRDEYPTEVLFEKADVKSVVDKDTLSFLNVNNSVTGANPALFIDTAYVNRVDADGIKNTCYQYLLAVNVDKDNSYYCPYNPTHNTQEWRDEHNGGKPCADAMENAAVKGRFLINLIDTAYAYKQEHLHNNPYINMVEADENKAKLSFVEGIHANDTLYITRKGGEVVKLGMTDPAFNVAKFAFRYVDNKAGSFKIQTQYKEYSAADQKAFDESANNEGYLRWVNGTVVVTNQYTNGETFNMEENYNGNPTANESVTVSSISVVAGNGTVTIKGAAGKKVAISNVLGQTVANAVLSSDEATISAPAGVVIVAVEGEAAVKAIVK